MTRWQRFFFEPASAKPLAAFRIGLALVLLLQAWMMRHTIADFSSSSGLVQRELADSFYSFFVPRLGVLVDLLAPLGVSEASCLMIACQLYIISLLMVLVGLFTRFACIAAWLLHWTLLNTGYSGAYGADMYAHIFMFYLMVIPSGQAWSLDCLVGRCSGEKTWEARLGLRVLQLHMCLSYCASGIEKATGGQWWNGEVLWKALTMPGYSTIDFHWLAHYPLIPMVLGWGTLAVETFYCLAVWPRQTRWVWVLATCGLHLGIAVFLRLHIFGLLMCVPTLSLFAVPAEPQLARSKE